MEDHRSARWAPGYDDALDLRVRVERHDGARGPVQVLSLAGDLDVQGATSLRRNLPEASAHRVVADLTGVAFLDSSGVGALIALHRRCAASGGSLVVCCAQQQPRQVLDVTAADTVLTVLPTLADALGVARTAG
ncbi:STAS domain-containing protein [Streptomyces sp. NP160]|uniref:STAS domain-containing protein n=1 Tax=Streptomyces sp. NP160 TaxID=2586637 RepID=UPI0015D5ECE4|nr:STAS domain-containing protein [Streptomyces sp. NP160]